MHRNTVRLSLALLAAIPLHSTSVLALPEQEIPIDYSVFEQAPVSDIEPDLPYNTSDLDLGENSTLTFPEGGFEDNPVDSVDDFELDPLLKKDKNGNLTQIHKIYNKAAPVIEALGGFIKKNLGFNVVPWLEYGDFLIGREKAGTLENQSEDTVAGIPIGVLQGPNGEVDPALVEAQALEEFKANQKGEVTLFGMPTDVVQKHLVGLSLTRAGLKKQQAVLGKHGQAFAKESLQMVNQLVKNAGDLSTNIDSQKSTQDVNKGLGKMMANNSLVSRAIYVEAQQSRLNQEKQLDVALRQREEAQQAKWGEEVDERLDDASLLHSSSVVFGFVYRQKPDKNTPPGTITATITTPSTPTRNPFLQ